MFTTRYVCSAGLGRPETLEALPVERRVACLQPIGRRSVVCRDGERWNGLPLEERREEPEGCERLYRDPRKRAAINNVGLACGTQRLSTTRWSADISSSAGELALVRIGQPLRPECAAWRYGDQFGRRRRRQMAITGTAVGGVGLLWWAALGPVRALPRSRDSTPTAACGTGSSTGARTRRSRASRVTTVRCTTYGLGTRACPRSCVLGDAEAIAKIADHLRQPTIISARPTERCAACDAHRGSTPS